MKDLLLQVYMNMFNKVYHDNFFSQKMMNIYIKISELSEFLIPHFEKT